MANFLQSKSRKSLQAKALILLSFCTLILSCSRTQIYETKPTSPIRVENTGYIYENDSVKISYIFWADKGQLLFHVYNKLKVPIYIDWKRSSFIQNGQKLDYWADKSVSNGVSSYHFYRDNGKMKTTQTTVKMERVTFIAPQSMVEQNSFLLQLTAFQLPSNSAFETLDIKGSSKKGKYQSFGQENSPLVFRNFLTFSTTEQGDNPFYVDNGFFVSKIIETKSTYVFNHFGDDNPSNIHAQLYDPTWFYLNK